MTAPTIRDEYPTKLKEAISRRNQTTLQGVCPCGATVANVEIVAPGPAAVWHEVDCPAPDAGELLDAWQAENPT